MPKLSEARFVERADVLSWGRVVRQPQRIARPAFRDELSRLIADPKWESTLAIGLRRSYGNSCLNSAGALIDATVLERFIAFDSQSGRLRAEAGISLSNVLQLVVPHGWFLPTTPGTRFVTLGGAVANDVHGKNHHRAATFGGSVVELGLQRSDGRRMALSSQSDPDLFAAIDRRPRTDRGDRMGRTATGPDPKRLSRRRNPTLRQPRRLLAARGRQRRLFRAHGRLDRLLVAWSAGGSRGFHPRKLGR